MFIIWGTKRTARKLGFVADFCPICREPREFKLSRIGAVSHLYYISFGSGKLTGHVIECCVCGQALTADPMGYAAYEKLPGSEIGLLIQTTFPKLKEIYAERLAAELKVRRSLKSLTQEERLKMIIEPFSLLNPAVEERFTRDTRMDKQSGIGCLGSLIVLAVLLAIAVNLREPLQGQVMTAAFILFGIGAIYTFVQLGLGPRRFLRTQIVPKIARTLDPLRPTEEELSATLSRCKAAQMKIGQKLKLKTLWDEIQRRASITSENPSN